MAYQAPELLLVGAAQNLVLFTSGGPDSQPICLTGRDTLPLDEVDYDAAAIW